MLVKYNQYIVEDRDEGGFYAQNADMEIIASKIFKYFNVPCAKVEKGIDNTVNKHQRKCIAVENFLEQDEELVEFSHYNGDAEFSTYLEKQINIALQGGKITVRRKR